MSFALTTAQILDQSKTVTRRIGWQTLSPGDRLQAIEKGQGLKKGEKVRKLAVLRVTSVRREPLNAITLSDVEREGFPWIPYRFVQMFCQSHRVPWRGDAALTSSIVGRQKTRPCEPRDMVTRIEFVYELDEAALNGEGE